MIVLEIVLNLLFEWIGYYLLLAIQRLGSFLRWLPQFHRASYSEICQLDGNTRLGSLALLIALLYWLL